MHRAYSPFLSSSLMCQAVFFLLPLLLPIISHLPRDIAVQRYIPRSAAGHLLNSSAYVSLIWVCKSIATVEVQGGRGRRRERGIEQAERRIACGQLVDVRASMSCGLHRAVKNSAFLHISCRASHVARPSQGGRVTKRKIEVS